jgi:hypothetical protein
MTFQAAITKDLINAIVAKCGITADRAAKELKAARATAKATGWPLADTLVTMGLV